MLRTLVWIGILGSALGAAACSSVSGESRYGAPAKATMAAPAARGAFAAEYADGVTAQLQGRAHEADRKIIRSADLRLDVDDVDATGHQIVRIANDAGGFVLSSSRLHYSIKVPATGLDPAVEAIEGLGKVTHKGLSGQDVTSEYVDLEVRLKNAQAARDAYEALLRKATSVEEMLKVETALHEVQERIELLEGRRKYLDEHLALSDIDIDLREVETPGPLHILWNVVVWTAGLLW